MATLTGPARALQLLTLGDTTAAAAAAREASTAAPDSLLAAALTRYLDSGEHRPVYDSPAAFAAFIRGGGNIRLYRAVSAALAGLYQDEQPMNLLDLGCGDGAALVPALQQSTHRPSHLDLLEPSVSMLETAVDAVTESALTQTVSTWQIPGQELLTTVPTDRTWDMVQSTFALQSLPPKDRAMVLSGLRGRVNRLAVVEFDVPDLVPGSDAALDSLAARYERGLAEYPHDQELLSQGFLMPVLTGLLNPAAARTNWEHPAAHWARQLDQTGYTDITITPVSDYWFSPAVLITARGIAPRSGDEQR